MIQQAIDSIISSVVALLNANSMTITGYATSIVVDGRPAYQIDIQHIIPPYILRMTSPTTVPYMDACKAHPGLSYDGNGTYTYVLNVTEHIDPPNLHIALAAYDEPSEAMYGRVELPTTYSPDWELNLRRAMAAKYHVKPGRGEFLIMNEWTVVDKRPIPLN